MVTRSGRASAPAHEFLWAVRITLILAVIVHIAAAFSLWKRAPYVPAGVVGPDGRWTARCRAQATPDVVTVEVTSRPEGAARAWRRSMVAAD
ncbi:hypothetical protein ACQBAU_00665 [Propionibacteriaceae bacterium Y2011]